MPSALLFHRQVLQVGTLVALVVLPGTGCNPKRSPTVAPDKPSIAAGPIHLPAGCPADSAPADTTQLNACLSSLEFDTTETVGDEQRLMVYGTGAGPKCIGDTTHTCRYGPLAKVEPVKGSQDIPDSALERGRIIARVFLRPGETESYPKFGLVPGHTTYWWVNTTKDSSYFLRDTLGSVTKVGRPLTRNTHPDSTFKQGLARWVWDPTDERLNGTCGSSCCKS